MPAAPSPSIDRARHLLAAGVPLSLLIDLADETGPDSVEILRREGRPQR